ncbi:APC family permease [Prauserella muralis]|uniref:Putrescine importer PuuP n=1 Tax=Prauserella muralis TaxID=588067 RepID=A0A2V4AH85_9PSEU|nr:APC family permease [Prauserella muralis]PXY19282.1 Putrescine importer PuuP [Prauserella muralis]TWE29222.1 amino acid/polyamine/organocation transporter (APC superfamily) [Prauserella muralis]
MSDATPGLRRTLRLGSVVLFGLAYLTPLIVLGTFGIVSDLTSGASPSAYVLALAAMLFTAYSYGTMARAYPVAGSAYTYVRRTIDSRAGFLVGWAVLLDYFFLPMVIWLIGGTYLQAQFPSVPFWVWIVAFVGATSCLNLLGIKVADKANYLLMAFQLLVVAIFVALSLRHLLAADGAGAWFSVTPFVNDSTTWGGVSAGAALAAYSFLGFDAVTTLTEETVDPRRTMPRAILLIALIGGGIFVVVAYTTQLVHPGTFASPDSAAFDVATTIAGNVFASVFLAGLVVAQFASGLAAQASASRLLFAMGRDAVLPRRVFGFLHARFGTPAFNIALTGGVGLVALVLDVSTSTSFINFGAFVAFTAVNLSVLALFLRERAAGRRPRLVPYVVVPAIGAGIDAWLLVNLDSAALVLGVIWLAAGVAYLAYLTRLFRVPPPELERAEHPEQAVSGH